MDHLNCIRAFVTVANMRSFTRSAEALNATPSTISRAISELENYTRSRLINRTTRHVQLAEGARAYYETCVRILEQLEEAEHSLTGDRDLMRGPLSVIAHPLAVASGLAEILETYGARAPNVDVEITVISDPINLENCDCDIALCPPNKILNSSAVSRTLLQSPHILVASTLYLDRVSRISSTADLSHHMLIYCRQHMIRNSELWIQENGIAKHVLTPRHRFHSNEIEAKNLVLGRLGIAMLPLCTVARELESGDLKQVLPASVIMQESIQLSAHYVHRRLMSKRARFFLDESLTFFSRPRTGFRSEKIQMVA